MRVLAFLLLTFLMLLLGCSGNPTANESEDAAANGSDNPPANGSDKTKPADSPMQASTRPAWADAIPVSSLPIQMCSDLTPENMFRESPRQPLDVEGPAVASQPAEGTLQPVEGADCAVPWPLPCPPGAHVLTFWGTGSAQTREFTLPSDGLLRIVARGGPMEVRVRRKDGRFLADRASLYGKPARLALMGIPRSGTYCLLVEAEPGLDWGVTVLSEAPSLD